MKRSHREGGHAGSGETAAIPRLEHRIQGGGGSRQFFEVSGRYRDASIRVELPRLTAGDARRVLTAARGVRVPSLGERHALLTELARWWPGDAALEGAALITGMPVSWLMQRIQEGRGLAERFAYRQSADSVATVYAGLPPDDPCEILHVISHALLAGAPLVLKASRREPFLAADAVRWMHAMDLPPGMLQLIYADEDSRAESLLLRDLVDAIDLALGTEDSRRRPGHRQSAGGSSCAVVLDASAALAHLSRAVAAPRNSRSERNFLCVGASNAERISAALTETYASLRPGDLLDRRTTLGQCDETAVHEVAASLGAAVAAGTMRPRPRMDPGRALHPAESLRRGLVVEHGEEPPGVDPWPIMTADWPVYVSGVRRVATVEEAERAIARASAWMASRRRAVSIYGAGLGRGASLAGSLGRFAEEVHVDRSPLGVDGWLHDGMDLNAILVRRGSGIAGRREPAGWHRGPPHRGHSPPS